MLSRLLLTALALSSAVSSAPLPNDLNQPKPAWLTTLENISGSPFGNGNNNGNNNGAGNNNVGNGNNNFGGNGNKNGNGNIFGNGNDVLSGNNGLKIGRNEQPASSWSNFVTDYYKNIAGSPFNNGNGNGNGNTAGSGNQDNGNGNFGQNGNGNGNNNYFGNGNGILSGNNGISLGKKVRRQSSIPPGTFYLVPPQLLDSLNQDVSQLFTVVIPKTGPAIIKGALTGNPNILTPPGAGKQVQKRQVLTGLENIIAQAVSDEAPPNRSGFFGINI